ncbi:MAG: Fic family protein [Candidatus Daviesbacteria bacterium]|nr:Fic family protein [Candidatus Daviesbacteria bacterium]
MVKNRKFESRLAQLPPAVFLKIAQIDELKGRWTQGTNLNPQLLGRLKRSVLITSTGASTRIEGARLSDEDVEDLMQGIAMQKFADREKQEVQGYFELLQIIFDAWEHIRFSENTVKHLHQELLKYVKKDQDHRGKYKSTNNKIEMVDEQGRRIGVIFDTTPAYLTPKQMQELVEWTKYALDAKLSHPLIIIGNFLVEFLNIHPFKDGNGRLSRILTNLLLLQAGYLYMPYVSHEKLIEDQKPQYYLALRKSQKTFKKGTGNITPWLEFFLEIILAQSKEAISLMSQERIEDILSNKQIAVWQYIQAVDEATNLQIAAATKIAYATVRQSLAKLLQLKKIESVGMGRSSRYRKI